jgi:hypothetical protein
MEEEEKANAMVLGLNEFNWPPPDFSLMCGPALPPAARGILCASVWLVPCWQVAPGFLCPDPELG